MKIGLVRRGFSPTGGAEAYLLRLARGLAEAGHEPWLITSVEWPHDCWPDRDTVILLPAKGPMQFSRAVRDTDLDVDVTFSLERVPGCDVYRAGDGVHAAWLRRRSQFEPAWKRWFHRFNPKHLALMALEKEVFRSARAVIVNSRMVEEEIEYWHSYPRSQIHLVRNGIGPAIRSTDRLSARYKLGVPEDAFCILFVGTGWERKGLAFAIRAVEQLGGNAILLVAGRGPAAQYDSPAAKFLGPTKDLSALFSAADIFTLPTIYDPYSNASLEALAAGLPVITTTANGVSEIIKPGIHGDTVEPGDIEGLVKAFKAWRSRRPGETAKACRELAAQYTIERNVRETLRVLTSVV